jgi:hypothetical protein
MQSNCANAFAWRRRAALVKINLAQQNRQPETRMSFARRIFYNAMLGGWAAFAGWLLSELLVLHRSTDVGWLGLFLAAALVGAAIGAGLSLLGVLANARFSASALARLAFCLAGGFVGGAVGGLIGNLIFWWAGSGAASAGSQSWLAVLRALGWMIMGLGIGGVEGLFDRSAKKIRNGLIGGAIGGLLGGLCFDPVVRLVGGNMSGRAVAFVLLGLCIGLFIGAAQIVLREAWLTVEEGFRPGRQLVLDVPVTVLGTSEKAQLPFIAFGAKGVEPVHVRIERRSDGRFVLRDNGTRTGTLVNGERSDEAVLENDDVIQLGINVVRFREAVRHVADDAETRAKPAKRSSPEREAKPAEIPAAPPPLALPAPKPAVAPQPKPAVQTLPPKPAPVSALGKPCPRCGKPGTPIPGAAHHLCMNCDTRF